ncbi:MAG: CotH kinase family protein [Oscillospiraceae bacterium]|nr:CotH kinase family protein [Oscillospiraceae bacterium]
MKRALCAAVCAALMVSMSGCSGDTVSSGSGQTSPPESTNSSEPAAVIPMEDPYYTPDYNPESLSDTWGGMQKEILGEPGQETEALIPSVFLTVNGDITRDEYTECRIEIDSSMTDDYPSTNPLSATIRGRGHSTWEWPKKPYKLKLDEKESLLGMTASKNWALLSNYADESMARNLIAFSMAEYLGSFEFTPKAVPVNLYMNGVYQGIYTLGELVEAKNSRLPLDERDDSPNTGYLLEVGGADPAYDARGLEFFDFPSGCAKNVMIKAPADDKLKQENYDYIYKYVTLADNAVTTLTNYDTYIDTDNFIDWFILHELTYNADSCFHRSCFLTKDRGQRLKMGPVWDFDLAFGNMYADNPRYDDWATVGNSNSSSYIGVNWFNYLMTDPDFRARARARWDEVKVGLLECAISTMEEAQKLIGASADENFAVWDTLSIANGFQPRQMAQYSTYNEQIGYIRRFLNNRYKWIDENL